MKIVVTILRLNYPIIRLTISLLILLSFVFVKPNSVLAITKSSITSGSAFSNQYIDVAKPAGTVDGDLILAIVTRESTSGMTPPAGWTQLFTRTNSPGYTMQAYYKVAASEGSTYQFTCTSCTSQGKLVYMQSYTGYNSATPFDVNVNQNNGVNGGNVNTMTFPSVTTNVDNDIIIGAGIMGNGGNRYSGLTAGWTEDVDSYNNWNGTFIMVSKVQVSAGATGTAVASYTNGIDITYGYGIAATIAIKAPTICSFPNSGNHTLSADCSLGGVSSNIVDGVDAGSGTVNTAILTVDTNVTLTVGSGNNQTLAFGSIINNGTIVIAKGVSAFLKKVPIWTVDADGDSYPATINPANFLAQSTQPAGYTRRTNASANGIDCNDSDVNVWRNQYYVDADGDTYASSTPTTGVCYGNTPPTGSVTTPGTDCYDSNANAKPGQTSYYTTNRGDGSFDYDCNGTQDKYPSYDCSTGFSAPGCVGSHPGGSPGYYAGIPACGSSAGWRYCNCYTGASCTSSVYSGSSGTCSSGCPTGTGNSCISFNTVNTTKTMSCR